MINNIKINDKVWFKTPWSDMPAKGIVSQIFDSFEMAHIESDNGTFPIMFCNMYPTQDALLQAMHDESEKNIAAYKSEVHSVEDLIRFMFNNNVSLCEEYTNYDARQAVKELALELLGITLDD